MWQTEVGIGVGYFLCVILVCGGKKSDNAGRKIAGEKDVTTGKIRIFMLASTISGSGLVVVGRDAILRPPEEKED